MAKAKPNPAAQAAIADAQARADAAKGTSTQTVVDTSTTEAAPAPKKELNPAIPSDKELAAKEKAKRDEDKAAKQKLKDEEKAAKAKQKAKEKAEREARLAELGKNYKGSMLALADKVKSGVYVKGLNGQLHSGNPIAMLFDGVSPTDVIRIGLDVLKLEENPYAALNVGQQSMNLRNRIRGAVKKETLKIEEIQDYITRNGIHRTTAEDVAKAQKDRAEAKAKREAEAAEKKAKAAAAPAESAQPEAQAA